ncbi:T9SS type A sorting domain-containing protein [Chryseobacterium sp. MDT2-18]|uniref:T9SS type A sorting domain-containing protein n=1 Tax=Chryseobacterium sp. MDT2-18 TaxID=1259136 RepID=UPI0027838AB2|nr:T9SS type A sorting domain-containing protein [Chryseobacterium sp. MDT2-18]MDQ0477372.1 hypothetical protein [Chryseobacterium sp. MDT2-18]
MKKFYSVFAAVIFAATINAQGAETFETQKVLTATYSNGTFAGETAGVTVNYFDSRNEGLGTTDDYSISGKGIILRGADQPSSVEFVIPNGVGFFSFNYRKAFIAGAYDRVVAVFVDGVQKSSVAPFGPAGADSTLGTLSTIVNKSGPVTVKISFPAGTSAGEKQITIDNVSWTAAPILAVGDINTTKVNLVKNTVVGETVMFTAKANVQILNMTGQVVKTASVNESTSLNVASLPHGMYIITAIVNGKAVSQKIMKK